MGSRSTSRLSSTNLHSNGRYQEENAGHEGREGQCLWQGRCMRGGQQGRQGQGGEGRGEVSELTAKARQLETELDLCSEKLGIVSLQLEEKEKALLASEAEMNALNRRVSGLEEDLEKTEEKLLQAAAKLDKAGTAADDSERAKKVFENKAGDDDKRI